MPKNRPKTKLINVYWIQLDKHVTKISIQQNKPCFTYNRDNNVYRLVKYVYHVYGSLTANTMGNSFTQRWVKYQQSK